MNVRTGFWRRGIAGPAVVLSVFVWAGLIGTPASAAQGDSLSLREALALAQRQAPAVKEAARNVEQARSAYRKLVGGLHPQVTLSGNAGGDETVGGATGDFGFRDPQASLNVGATVPLVELMGTPSAERELAEYEVRAAERALSQAGEDAELAALEAYIGVLNAENNVRLSRRSLEKLARLVEQTRLRYELGEATRLDVMEAERKQSDGELALAQAENALETAYAGLNQALGRPLDTAVNVTPFDWEEPGGRTGDLASAVETAFQRRVEVLLAEEQLQIFERRLELTPDPGEPFVTFSGGYDGEDGSIAIRRTKSGAAIGGGGATEIGRWQLALDGTVTTAESTPPTPPDGGPLGWNVSVGVTWPLYDGGQADETRRQNELQRQALRAAIEQAREGVRLDVRSRRAALELAYKTLEIRTKALAQAEESLRVIRLQHEAGAVTDSDLLDAELTALQARSDVDAARYEIWLATAAYARSQGLTIDAVIDGVSRDEEGAR